MVRRTEYNDSSGSYVITNDLKFLHDGWHYLAELNATNNALVRSYLWGSDLSGSMTGAGGWCLLTEDVEKHRKRQRSML